MALPSVTTNVLGDDSLAVFDTIVIGSGAGGATVAHTLAKAGHKLVLFDIDAKKAAAVAATNECEVAESLADLGSKSSTVVTMLPDGKLVRKALLGDNDSGKNCITETLKPGSLIIDMSSSSPMGTRELGALLEKKSRRSDCPGRGAARHSDLLHRGWDEHHRQPLPRRACVAVHQHLHGKNDAPTTIRTCLVSAARSPECSRHWTFWTPGSRLPMSVGGTTSRSD